MNVGETTTKETDAAREFPDITAWRDKREEIVSTHDARVQRLQAKLEEAGAAALDRVESLDGAGYVGTLDAEPATSRPAALEQLI